MQRVCLLHPPVQQGGAVQRLTEALRQKEVAATELSLLIQELQALRHNLTALRGGTWRSRTGNTGTWTCICQRGSTFYFEMWCKWGFFTHTQGLILWTTYWMKWLRHVVILLRIVSIYCHHQTDHLVLLRDIVNNLHPADVSIFVALARVDLNINWR